ncbi:MAG: universal stress protein [Candidatus Dormibacteraeota bacterium]|nr:universal stress protein [Candidatus Dormibacteraeota bacterium]
MTDSQEDPRTPEGAPVTETPSLMRELAVAVDASPPSREGLRLAADIARRTGARVTVVHIRHAPALEEMGAEAGGISLEETLAGVEQAARQDAMDIFGEASAGWRFVVRTGSHGRDIEAAKELEVDLIIVGSKPHSTLHNLVLGSTARYLVAHSPVQVLVAR